MPRKKATSQPNPAQEHFEKGWELVRNHPLFWTLAQNVRINRKEGNLCAGDGWAVVTSNGVIHVHPKRNALPAEWAYVLAHCMLHLGFCHFDTRLHSKDWNDACDWFLLGFLRRIQIGKPPADIAITLEPPATSEERIYAILREQGAPVGWLGCGTAGLHAGDMVYEQAPREQQGDRRPRWQEWFAQGLSWAVQDAVVTASGEDVPQHTANRHKSPAQRAREWFINAYPLLGALAASFKIVEDAQVCARLGISVAAVDPEAREIFFNPACDPNKQSWRPYFNGRGWQTYYNLGAGFTEAEYRFVMAHELLHVGLRHDVRRQGRDPYLWNVACFPAGTWTGSGEPIEAVATMQREYEGDLVYIDAQAGAIRCTPEHPFMARKRLGCSYPIRLGEPAWTEAKDLRIGDYLLVPKLRETRDDTVIDLGEPIRDGPATMGRHTFSNRTVKEIPLNEDTAWLIGLYVAQGSASPRVLLSLGAHEREVAEKAASIFRRIGYSATLSVAGTSLIVGTGAVEFGRWLKLHCGIGAHTKHIPQIILRHRDPCIRRGFLDGLVTGDRHVRKQTASSTTVWMLASVSARLISDVALLLAQDGIGGAHDIMRRPPRTIGERPTDKDPVLHRFHWIPAGVADTHRTMNARSVASSSVRWKADEHGVWYRIRSLDTRPFTGTVYNRTTPDHTYITNGYLVHNCDFVINAWLTEMRVGEMPKIGALHDASLAGESAESIYDRIVTDLRRYRRLATMRGVGESDILERGQPGWWERGAGVDLDAFYRGCLSQGLSYCEQTGRGFLPAGLIEEIRALTQPPIPWDVELARWFDEHFPPLELVRSYARPSRHQSSTPDIPRPRWVLPPDWAEGRTFGVVLDTSGSMDRSTLAKALGAIASYSMARDVPAARVVFCDAAAYDQGYMPPQDIADEVRVRGRGGTVLQPGIDLLERAEDFPEDGPLLIITDGYCDRLSIRRDHAFLMPEGRSLPFVPKGPVFRIK